MWRGKSLFMTVFFWPTKHLRSVRAPLNPVFYCGPAVTRRVNNAPKNKKTLICRKCFWCYVPRKANCQCSNACKAFWQKCISIFIPNAKTEWRSLSKHDKCGELVFTFRPHPGRTGKPNRSWCATQMAWSFSFLFAKLLSGIKYFMKSRSKAMLSKGKPIRWLIKWRGHFQNLTIRWRQLELLLAVQTRVNSAMNVERN